VDPHRRRGGGVTPAARPSVEAELDTAHRDRTCGADRASRLPSGDRAGAFRGHAGPITWCSTPPDHCGDPDDDRRRRARGHEADRLAGERRLGALVRSSHPTRPTAKLLLLAEWANRVRENTARFLARQPPVGIIDLAAATGDRAFRRRRQILPVSLGTDLVTKACLVGQGAVRPMTSGQRNGWVSPRPHASHRAVLSARGRSPGRLPQRSR
jgi:hypothetical protein